MRLESSKQLNRELKTKLNRLKEYLANKTVVVAYSGGVDSTVLAEASHRFSRRSLAVTASSPTVLPGEIEDAAELAKSRDWEHRIIQHNELEDENFVSNPANRCYYCKKGLSKELREIAKEIHADLIIEGTNVSEVGGHRPGLQALHENSINSPLLLNDFTKEDIRTLAYHFGLPNADKPSLACLSSRFPTGVTITPAKLKRVGLAERYIIDTYGVKSLRVRDHEGLARIEVAPEERDKLMHVSVFDDLNYKLKELGFTYVSIDCGGYRTGSLSEVHLTDT